MKILSLLTWLAGTSTSMALTVGDKVPDMAIPSTGGTDVNLQHAGNAWKVLYFYPKSFTPGCTKQACGLRDAQSTLTELGVKVYGVSTDDMKTQNEFKAKYGLPFDLLADEEKKLSKAFDVLNIAGFSKRVTFIINPEGLITDRMDSVNVETHDQDVARIIKKHLGQE